MCTQKSSLFQAQKEDVGHLAGPANQRCENSATGETKGMSHILREALRLDVHLSQEGICVSGDKGTYLTLV